jgi:hypothetical protein
MLEDLTTGEHAAGVGQHVVQQLVLGGREFDRATSSPDVAGIFVEFQIGIGQAVFARSYPGGSS